MTYILRQTIWRNLYVYFAAFFQNLAQSGLSSRDVGSIKEVTRWNIWCKNYIGAASQILGRQTTVKPVRQ